MEAFDRAPPTQAAHGPVAEMGRADVASRADRSCLDAPVLRGTGMKEAARRSEPQHSGVTAIPCVTRGP